MPDTALAALARLPGVDGVSLDRRVHGTLERTGATVGATWVQDTLGLDGTGVGIAIIDSGVANWHDDLGTSRVTRFVDFVNFQPAAYDDYGHGTHVAGIIAGNGHDSGGRRRGVAPGATLLVEKVLDASGQGYISNVIAAIDYAIANKDALGPAGHQPLGRRRRVRVVHDRPADARRQARRRSGPRRRLRRGQSRQGTPTASRSTARIGAPGNAPWVHHRRRVEPQRHGRPRPTTPSRASARAGRPRSTTRPSRTSSRRASASSRSPRPAARSSTPSR